ncbi:MAG: rod shape-determining protein MreD [Planctomycetota bacterium]|jgi:rod shape-determining protein MreD
MRWVYFVILTVVAVIAQTTVVQVMWLRTPVGYVGPEVLASVAVFAALHARTRVDAALAGWTSGFALDLLMSGPGMGLMSLLYMTACVGVHGVREIAFRDRAVTQMVLALAFCLFVYALVTAYDLLSGSIGGQSVFRQLVQSAGLAAYTALVTPVVCRILKHFQRWLVPVPSGRRRR